MRFDARRTRMSEALVFEGVAHPPAKPLREHPADLSHGEIAAIARGGTHGLPLHVEHDTAANSVGRVLTSWQGRKGELRVMGQVTDPSVAQRVRGGDLRGLSLGTDCVQAMNGDVLARNQRELSLCGEGRRTGTWVDHIDGQRVHSVECFSKTAGWR
jgi:hypothetical protein